MSKLDVLGLYREAEGRTVGTHTVTETLDKFLELHPFLQNSPHLYSFADFNSNLTTCTDYTTQEGMRWCTLREVVNCNIQMFQLIIPEFFNDIFQERNTWVLG